MTTPILREGFTTGTCAAAATAAALELMLTGVVAQTIKVPLPPFSEQASWPGVAPKWIELSPAHAGFGIAPDSGLNIQEDQIAAHAGLIKDGGDDPDVTNGLMIYATIVARQQSSQVALLTSSLPFLDIRAGRGVGIVTKAGLCLPPGEAAINPVPRKQIFWAAYRSFQEASIACSWHCQVLPPLQVYISVPGGEAIAEKTMNPRLGILGGISILGTKGIVKPFSHKAWADTIRQAIAFARASEARTICLCTGRSSEALLKDSWPQLPDASFIQVADMVKHSLETAGLAGFTELVWGCFFGKLCKIAQGFPDTHAHRGEMDLSLLEDICKKYQASCAPGISECPTARVALKRILEEENAELILKEVVSLAKKCLEKFAGQPVTVHLFHEDGYELIKL